MKPSPTLLLTTLALASASASHAQPITNTLGQTGTIPTTMPGFFNSVAQYFTSINTNYDFHSTAEITLGAAYQSGINFGSDLGLRYKYDLGTNMGVCFESVTRNAGVNGIIVSEQAGVGVYYIQHDLELSAGLDAGYRFDANQPALTFYADVRKLLTENTYAGLRLGYETDFSSASPGAPVITIETGFKF